MPILYPFRDRRIYWLKIYGLPLSPTPVSFEALARGTCGMAVGRKKK